MARIFWLVIIAAMFILVGCSTPQIYTIGEEFNIQNVSNIKIGITSQNEILNFFGKPLKEGISNGNTIYFYSQENIIFEKRYKVKREGNTLVIEFDQNGKVKNYYFNVPSNGAPLFGYLIHHGRIEKQQEETQQKQLLIHSESDL